MIDKKQLEFDLTMLGPEDTLIKIIETAGYHFSESDTIGDIDICVKTKESASTKEDVIKFIDAINKITELNLVIVDENTLNEEEVSLQYHTEDGRFGGETYFLPKDSPVYILSNFELAYSEEGLIFT